MKGAEIQMLHDSFRYIMLLKDLTFMNFISIEFILFIACNYILY
jgi:hypothetical protein